MEFRILGPLEVRVDDEPLPLGGGRQRALLAVLLLQANRVVPTDRLVDAIWGTAPPATATAQVQSQISALRRILARGDPDGERIITQPPGYRIQVQPGELDLAVFDHHVSAAAEALAQGDLEPAASGFHAALALWRGAALGDVAGTVVENEAARLSERRLAVLEQRVDADLALGRHAELVGELGAFVAEHPLREAPRARLMLALYRCGRQAEALAAYREARQVLVDELGLEPGPELQRLEQAILAADPALDPSTADGPTAPRPRPPSEPHSVLVPAQLPADIGDFTGRSKLAAKVCDLLASDTDAQDPPRPLVVSAIAGRAGVGKTTLAVHAAHRVRDRFPDGQLHIDLRGAEAHPLDPGEVLEQFLRALGVHGSAVPADTEERSQLYRSRLAERRALVLLDNAGSEAQVRPLLPGTGQCAVLVTSRVRLAALEGARQVDVDILASEQAVELLGRVAGPERIAAEPVAAHEVARLCGYLPLAVRIAGARLAARPQWPLSRLAAALADEHRLLDELRAGDLEVRASLALSYNGLDSNAQRAFRRLGLLAAPDFPAWLMAALLDVDLPQAERMLDRLVDAQLLDFSGHDVTGQDRYRIHDLVRAYARERVESDEPSAERTAAIQRVLGGWLTLVERAAEPMVALSRWRWVPKGGAPRWRPDRAAAESLLADPSAWLEVERVLLVAAIEQAAADDQAELAWELAVSLAPFLQARGYLDDWRRTHELALAATQRAGTSRGEAAIWYRLGELHLLQDCEADAFDCLEQAEASFAAAGDRQGGAYARAGLGVVHRQRGRPQHALRCFDEAAESLGGLADRTGEAEILLWIARFHFQQPRLGDPQTHLDRALDACRQAGLPDRQAPILLMQALLQEQEGHTHEAVEYLRQCVLLVGQLTEHVGDTHILEPNLKMFIEPARRPEAISILQRCLGVFRADKDRSGEALTLRFLGGLFRIDSRPQEAVHHLGDAAEIWGQIGQPLRQARALRGIGDVHATAGDRSAAHASWHRALEVFQQHGFPEADELAQRLDQ